MHLPPQHVIEQAFGARVAGIVTHEEHGAGGGTSGVVGSRAAGPSRVSFAVPDAGLPIAYTLEAILELLNRSTLGVAANAEEPPDFSPAQWLSGLLYYFNPPVLAEPAPSETAIELPFRLILSPNERAGFSHATTPVRDGSGTRSELWHSRLSLAPGSEGDEADAAKRPVRAIWMRTGEGVAWSPTNPAAPVIGQPEPFPVNPMEQRDRADIVHLSSNRAFRKQTGADFDPSPVAVGRLSLSSLGAWLTSRGQWDPPALISLIEWTHRAAQGRDHFVRIVRQGFLYPFCHLAALVTVTERKFQPAFPGDPAVLMQRKYVIVRQPTREYPPGAAPAGLWHTMPLRSIQIKTLVTPDLEPTDEDLCFLIRPKGATEPLPFKLTGVDAEKNSIELSSPLVWIDSTVAWDKPTLEKAQNLYDNAPCHVLNAGGADLALAPSPTGDAVYPTGELVFTAKPQPQPKPPLPPADKQPGFWPELVRADVHAPVVEILTGKAKPASIAYHDTYRTHGLGGDNRTELIAQLAGALPLNFAGKGDRAGALLQPSMSIEGLSRQLGVVGGAAAKLADIAHGTFKPEDFFAGLNARLFGVFTLDQVLAALTGALPSDLPRIVTERAGDLLTARHVWEPVPQSFPAQDPIFVVKPGVTKVRLAASIDARAAGGKSEIDAWIKDFQLNLLGGSKTFIEIEFKKIEFKAHAGKKADVDVQMGRLRFVGPLSFVEQLKEIIPLDGFSDPPALEVDAQGIRSSFSLSLPDLAVGVFALQNISLGAGFAIPFAVGPLTFSFNVCKRQEPFLLTVSLFAGGGFFALAIDPQGVQRLEAALEFGANAAINLGVAQGGVHVMAGIYFKIETAKGATLSGYFRLGGNMSVLGLISAAIELYLALTYQDPGKALGRATLTIEIDIFLFSMSVEVSCERKFAGSANDPTFHELMQRYKDPATGTFVRPWNLYCAAYA